MKLYFTPDKKEKVEEILEKEKITDTAYGAFIEAKDPFEAAKKAEGLKGIIDGFEIVQGNMDDVFINVTSKNGRMD